MGMYYDMEGKEISVDKWMRLFAKPRQIAIDLLPNGINVSTVWLGIDHGIGVGEPMIFETMVFPQDSWDDMECERYSTKKEARAGHEVLVKKYKRLEK